ncbi:MAG: YbjQ family protein [Actinobacteria bacterium]|nr:MAG: YbjQ family protein [Actinomycetota bacterium]
MTSSGYSAHVLVVTMENLPGYHLRAILGEVVGVTARPQNKFTEGVRPLIGSGLTEAGERVLIAGRREAVERMAHHAREMGANAVLAMRFDHRVISAGWVEICAYGTAVVAIPRQRVPRARRTPADDAGQPPPAMHETTMTMDAPD